MLSGKTLFDKLQDYKGQYGVSAGARIGVLPASTASLGAGERSDSYSDAQDAAKPNDLDLFLRIFPGDKGHRLTRTGSSVDSFLGQDDSFGNLRDRLLPPPADNVLTSLGFSGSGGFIPERFARNWCEKVTRVKADRLSAMEEEMRARAAAAMLRASQELEAGSSVGWKDDGIGRSLRGVEGRMRPRSSVTGRKQIRRALSLATREQCAKRGLSRIGSTETTSTIDTLLRSFDSDWPSHSSLGDREPKCQAITNDINPLEHRETTAVNASGTYAGMKTMSPLTTSSRVANLENCNCLSDSRDSEMNGSFSTDAATSLTKPKNISPPSNTEGSSVGALPSSPSYKLEDLSEVIMPQKIAESVQFLKLSLESNVAVDSGAMSAILGSVERYLVADIEHKGLRPNIDSSGGVEIPTSFPSDQRTSNANISTDRINSDRFVVNYLRKLSKEVQTDDRSLSPIIFKNYEPNDCEYSDDDDSPLQSNFGEGTNEINQTVQRDRYSEADECLTNDVLAEIESEDRSLWNLTIDSEVYKCLTDNTSASALQTIELESATTNKNDDVLNLLCETCLSTIKSIIRQKVDWETLCARYLGITTKSNLKLKVTRHTDKKSTTQLKTCNETIGSKTKRKTRNRYLVKSNIRLQKKSRVVTGAALSKRVKTRKFRKLVAGRLVGPKLRQKRTNQTVGIALEKTATEDEPMVEKELRQSDTEEEGATSRDPGWSGTVQPQPMMFEDFVERLHDRKPVSSTVRLRGGQPYTSFGSRKTRRTRQRFSSRKSNSLDVDDPRAQSSSDDDASTGEPPGRAVANYYSLREWSCISDVVNNLRSSSTTGLVAGEPNLSKDALPDLSRIFSAGGRYNRMQLKTGLNAADLLESSRKDPDDDADSAVDCSEHRKSCHRSWFQMQKSVKELIQAEEDSDVDIPSVAEGWWTAKENEDSEMLLAEEDGVPLQPLILRQRDTCDALSVDEDDESGLNATLPEEESNNSIRDSAMWNDFESLSVQPLQDIFNLKSAEGTQISNGDIFDVDGFAILPLQAGLCRGKDSEVKEYDTSGDLLAELSEAKCDNFWQLRQMGSLDVNVISQTGDSCSALVSEWLVNSKDSNNSSMSDTEKKATPSFAVMELNEPPVALNPETPPESLPSSFEVERPQLTNHFLSHRDDVDLTLESVSSSSPLIFSVESLVCSSSGTNESEDGESNCYGCGTKALDEEAYRASSNSFENKSTSNGSEEVQEPERPNGSVEEAAPLPGDAASRVEPPSKSGSYRHNGSSNRALFIPTCNNDDKDADKKEFNKSDWLQGNVLRKIRHFENKHNTDKDKGKIASRCRPELTGAHRAEKSAEILKRCRLLKERTNLKEKHEDDPLQLKYNRSSSNDLSGTLLEISESITRIWTDTCSANADGQAQNEDSQKSVKGCSTIVMELCRRFEGGGDGHLETASNSNHLETASRSTSRAISAPRNDLPLSGVYRSTLSVDTDSSTILSSTSIAKDIVENLRWKLEQQFLETTEARKGLQRKSEASVQFTTNDLEELIQSAADETKNKILSQQNLALPPPAST